MRASSDLQKSGIGTLNITWARGAWWTSSVLKDKVGWLKVKVILQGEKNGRTAF